MNADMSKTLTKTYYLTHAKHNNWYFVKKKSDKHIINISSTYKINPSIAVLFHTIYKGIKKNKHQ